MAYEGMTLRAVAPERDLYTEDGRRSIAEAVEFGLRCIPPIRRHTNEHDLIVASVFPYFPVLGTVLARAGTSTPLITTWHEVWMDYWKNYLGLLAPGGRFIERLTAATPQHPIAVSGVTADRLARIGVTQEDITVIPNGIDYARIQSIEPATPGYDVVFVGRLIEDKRVDRLLSAFDSVAKTTDTTLGIIGDGPAADTLQRQADNLDVRDQIDFLGFLKDYEDVLAQMRAAQVFASASTREGFGIAALEALAADCTVVVADHPESAAAEVVGDAGLTVKPSTTGMEEGLRTALFEMPDLTDPTERAADFDWRAVTDKAERVYTSVIES